MEKQQQHIHDQDSSGSNRTVSDPLDTRLGSESDEEANTIDPFGDFTRNGMMFRVNEESLDYKYCVEYFSRGMGTAGAAVTEVVAVHKNSFSGFIPRARRETFKAYTAAVARKCSGNSNNRCGWFKGKTKDEITDVLVNGFSSKFGNHECGGRIELIPTGFGSDAVVGQEVGEDGMRHVLMCQVILGKVEVVGSGSKQAVPSSNEFDAGVDSVENPRRYYVWSPFMNSHVLPGYVVSFKGPVSFEGYVNTTSTTTNAAVGGAGAVGQVNALNRRGGPPVRRYTTAALVAALTRFLAPRELRIVMRLMSDYRAKRITGEELKRRTRLVAGDRLISAMRLIGGGSRMENGNVRDIYIPGLITVLAGLLPASKMARLTKSLEDFRAKKITRLQLVRSVRVIVGNDNVLVQAIGSYRMSRQLRQQRSNV